MMSNLMGYVWKSSDDDSMLQQIGSAALQLIVACARQVSTADWTVQAKLGRQGWSSETVQALRHLLGFEQTFGGRLFIPSVVTDLIPWLQPDTAGKADEAQLQAYKVRRASH